MSWWHHLMGKKERQDDSEVTPTIQKTDVKLLPESSSPSTTLTDPLTTSPTLATTTNAKSSAAVAADEKKKLGARTKAIDVFKKMKAQFADPYDLFREIVQNSIDAGTDKTEFTFEWDYLLSGDLRARYVKCFKHELTRDGTTIDSILAGLPEEISVNASGEIKEFHSILGNGYAQPQLEERLSLGRAGIKYYVSMLNENDLTSLTPEAAQDLSERNNLIVDSFAIAEYVVETLPTDKLIFYFDRLLEVQKRRELGRNYWFSSSKKIKPQLDILINRRHRHLQKRAEEGDALAQAALAFSEEELTARASARWSTPEAKLTEAETSLCSYLDSVATPAKTKLEKVFENVPMKLKITARDYGRGMTNKEREQFLKKIFASSKGKDLEQIGRFGVGFVSVFALDPTSVVVESTRAGESWEYHFLPNYVDGTVPGALYDPENPLDKGTKITITVDHKTSSEIETIIDEARKHLLRDCRYVEKPIYFNGERITADFDLDAPVKVRFGKKGIEGVIGLVQSDKSSYGVYNNRIRLEGQDKNLADTLLKEEGLFGSKRKESRHFGFAIVVSSKYLNYDIARSKVVRDGNFEGIVGVLEDQEEALAKEAFSFVESIAQKGYRDSEAERISLRFIDYYLDRKIKTAENKIIFPKFRKHRRMIKELEDLLPEAILDRDLLHTIDEEPWTVRQILHYVQQGHPSLQYAQKKTELVAEFQRNGEVVFKEPTGYIRSITQKFALENFLEKRFATTKKSETISLIEEAFIQGLADAVRHSPLRRRGFRTILGSHLDPKEKDQPYILSYGSGGMLYYDVQQQRTIDDRLSPWLGTVGSHYRSLGANLYQDTLVINFENSYIQQVMLHEQLYHDGQGYQLLTQLLCAGEYVNQDGFISRILRKERRRSGRNVYRSGSMNREEFIRGAAVPSLAPHSAATEDQKSKTAIDQTINPATDQATNQATNMEVDDD